MDHPWWRGAVIYQIYPRSFHDGDGDGVGDLPGIRAHLRHVAALGVDAVWISPFFKSPQKDFGYDVEDYCAVDPMFGTLDDFDAVLAEAHALGLKVLIDMVWSHTSDRHPWFDESRRALHGDKAEWYVWADPRPDGGPPNNWLSVFGGGAWVWEPRRHQYYLTHFLPEQPALNVRHPGVVEALMDTGRFWLERGVDGFRLDAIDFMAHDTELHDNPPRPLDHRPTRPFSYQRHVHDMAHPDTLRILERIRALLDAYPGAAAMAEVGSESCALEPLARAGLYTRAGAESGSGRHMHMAYSLRMMKQPGTAEGLGAFIDEAMRESADGWLCWAFSNHDVPRVASRWGGGDPRATRLFMTLLLCLRGSVCLYQGEELGLSEAEVPYENLRDPFGLNYWPEFKGRDGSRTPMPWQAAAPHAGFSTAEPWLPVPDDHRAAAVDVQEADAGSMLHLTRRLIGWRKAHPALRIGDLERLEAESPVLLLRRTLGTERLLLSFNLSGDAVALPTVSGERIPVPGQDPGGPELPAWGVAAWRETS